MAQTPDINDTFLREVDDDLRRDRLRDFGKKYGNWLIGAVILFLVASGGFIWWQQHQQQRSEAQVEQLAKIYHDIALGNDSKAPAELDGLVDSSSVSVRASAMFTRAALAIQKNDVPTALAKYRAIAADSSFPQPYRDIALIRQTALEFDRIKPDEVVARMKPLASPGGPWFGTAGEMTAMALIKQGKKDDAGRLFAAIARDKTVPEAIRARSVQLAGSFGVDASDALDPPAQ